MTQAELEREVAGATGESISTIRSMGFSLENPGDLSEPEPIAAPNVIDWDDHHSIELPRRRHRPLRMAA
jgi:hypothetical protein